MKVNNYRDLAVWQRSLEIAHTIRQSTLAFPKHETFGLASQIQRAAVSIPANIAEGCGRRGRTELRQFLYVSRGSASELEYFLLLARDLRMLDPAKHRQAETELLEIKRMLAALPQRIGP